MDGDTFYAIVGSIIGVLGLCTVIGCAYLCARGCKHAQAVTSPEHSHANPHAVDDFTPTAPPLMFAPDVSATLPLPAVDDKLEVPVVIVEPPPVDSGWEAPLPPPPFNENSTAYDASGPSPPAVQLQSYRVAYGPGNATAASANESSASGGPVVL